MSDFVKNEEEYEIVKAVENSIKIENVDKESLVNLAIKWRMHIGIPNSDVEEELLLIAGFIYQNYPYLTIGEVELAMKLSILRKLKDTEFFGYFSPMYVAKVLDSYLYYRKITMADVIRQREKAIQEEKEILNKPSPSEQADRFRSLFKEFYKEWKEKGEINDPFNLAYNYLRKVNILQVPQEMITKAQEYGRKKTDEYLKNRREEGKKISFYSSELVGNQEKRYARNYCVQKFFENIDINVLCNNIIPEHFVN